MRHTSRIRSQPQHLSRCLEWPINMPDSTPCAIQRQRHVTTLHAPQSRSAHPVNLAPADRPWKSPSDCRLTYWPTLSSIHSSASASLNCCHCCTNNPIVVVECFLLVVSRYRATCSSSLESRQFLSCQNPLIVYGSRSKPTGYPKGRHSSSPSELPV